VVSFFMYTVYTLGFRGVNSGAEQAQTGAGKTARDQAAVHPKVVIPAQAGIALAAPFIADE